MGLVMTDKQPSITMDELWEASPCNWCLLREICHIYCAAKVDWLRIFHGFDTFQELREFFRIFPPELQPHQQYRMDVVHQRK